MARSTSDERRQHIAGLIANSLTPDAISFVESKHLLRLLGEINDIEIILLRFYLHPTMGGDEEFRSKHKEVLRLVPAYIGSPESDLDKHTLQESHKQHLAQLGLLGERFQLDSTTKMPILGNWCAKGAGV